MQNFNLEYQQKISRFLPVYLLAVTLALLAGCGDTPPVEVPPPTTVITTAATLQLAASTTSVPSDNSAASTITVTALSATNAALPNITVNLSTDTGIVSAGSVVTDAAGMATFTFSSGTASLANRTATITATAGATAQIPIQIAGSTLVVFSGGLSTVPDDGSSPVDIVFQAKNAVNAGIAGAPISVASTGPGLVTLTPSSGVTDANGKFTTRVAGVTAGIGTATITATSVGSTASTTVNVTQSTTTFYISQTVLTKPAGVQPAVIAPATVSMALQDSLRITVSVPPATLPQSVTFATSVGSLNGGGTSATVVVPAAGGLASVDLTTSSAGVASVQAYVSSTTSDTLTVFMTASTPAKITLQATPSIIPRSLGSTTGASTLIAKVTDASDQPVGDAPVHFSIVNPTGGGETVSPVVAYTTSSPSGSGLTLGEAMTSFTSGSLTTDNNGVQIRATVLGTTVQTEPLGINLTASGNDAGIVIGGLAGSVAFGTATELFENGNGSAYVLPMSVLVADSSGAPAPVGTVVNLSLWPIAWSTGSGCMPDYDYNSKHGTFMNEDANENVILDTAEDGTRKYYSSGSTTTTTCIPNAPPATGCTNVTATSAAGTVDTQITPQNSTAGTITSTNINDAPGTVTLGAGGVGEFNLTYGKTNALWIVVRIRATTKVAGSDAVGEVRFRLTASIKDVDLPDTCRIPNSPFVY